MQKPHLPAGVKSPAEIACYSLADQSVFLMTLLEYLLRGFDGLRTSTDAHLNYLIDLHGSKFTCTEREIQRARWVRNQIVHGTGKASYTDIRLAVTALQIAIDDVLMMAPSTTQRKLVAVA